MQTINSNSTVYTCHEPSTTNAQTKDVNVGSREPNARLEPIIRKIGRTFGRERDEIERVIATFKTNWLTEVSHWTALSETCKKNLNIPLSLKFELDRICLSLEQQRNVLAIEQVPHKDVPAVCDGYCYYTQLGDIIRLEFHSHDFEFNCNDPLNELFVKLNKEGILYIDKTERKKVHTQTKMKYAFVPGRRLTICTGAGTRRYAVKEMGSFKAVEKWLRTLGLEDVMTTCHTFDDLGLDDFLVLPFLGPTVLEDMGITSATDKRKILRGVKALQDCTEHEFVGSWVRFLGFAMFEFCFVENMVDISIVPYLKPEDLRDIGFKEQKDIDLFLAAIKYYREYSSAEATFAWLHSQGLGQYAYQFARYNIPFYCLPLVNFFIIDEMGVTSDDQVLLSALQNLRTSPCYVVKGMCYWLRDLELEHYSLVFARNLVVDFVESLTILNDHTINRLIDYAATREKMKAAVREMKEVQFYYSASASLLQELVVEKYSKLFAKHRISIDVLPLLNETNLVEMGFSDAKDRETILDAVKSIKEELPAALRLFSSNEPNLYRIDQKDPIPKRKWDIKATSTSLSSFSGNTRLDYHQMDELYDFIYRKDMACKKRMSNNKHSHETSLSRSPLGALVKGTTSANGSDINSRTSSKGNGGGAIVVAPASPIPSGPASPAASPTKSQKKARQRLRRKQRKANAKANGDPASSTVNENSPQQELEETQPQEDATVNSEREKQEVLEKQRKEQMKLKEKERQERERREREVLEKAKRDKEEKERQEKERQEKERLERARQEKEKLEKEQQEKERRDKERREKEKQEKEKQDREREKQKQKILQQKESEKEVVHKYEVMDQGQKVRINEQRNSPVTESRKNTASKNNKDNKTARTVKENPASPTVTTKTTVTVEAKNSTATIVSVNRRKGSQEEAALQPVKRNNDKNNILVAKKDSEQEKPSNSSRPKNVKGRNNVKNTGRTEQLKQKQSGLDEDKLASMLDEEIMRLFEQEEEEEDSLDGLDAETKALLDKEVEEFSKRLESINNNSYKKAPMPPCLKDLGLLFANALPGQKNGGAAPISTKI